MPGQCYQCGDEFGFFKKEHGCKNCGFAFCSKCLHASKIRVPKRNNEKHHVCGKCHKILSGQIQEKPKEIQSLPKAYLKRMEALKEREGQTEPSNHPSKNTKTKSGMTSQGLATADRDIQQRLEKLREKEKVKVSDSDIRTRLDNLKGTNLQPNSGLQPSVLQRDRRLQPEQVDDLLEEISAEVEIDSHRPDAAQEVEARLSRLRNDEKAQKPEKPPDNNLDKSTPQDYKWSLYQKNIAVVPADKQDTDLSEVERLMAQAAKETEEDAGRAVDGLMKDKEMMERLKEIQKEQGEKSECENFAVTGEGLSPLQSDDDSEDEDAESQRIIARYLAEAAIDEKVEEKSENKTPGVEMKGPGPIQFKPPTSDDFAQDDELPFCCICEEDATQRCLDCEMDIFCPRCYRECHNEMGITNHRSLPYRAPKEYS